MQHKRSFGIVDNRGVDFYTLTNPSGMEVSLTNYGGTVTSVRIPLEGGGFGHNFVLNADKTTPCATLFGEDTGITMEMSTSKRGCNCIREIILI